MKVVLVLVAPIYSLPPTLSLLDNLLTNGHEVVLITEEIKTIPEYLRNHKNLQLFDVSYGEINNRIKRLLAQIIKRYKIRKLIKKNMSEGAILWTMTDLTVLTIGNITRKYNHVFQLMELVEDSPIHHRLTWLKVKLKKYVTPKCRMVVTEYNRANIQKVWWNLDKLPYILPNKPYRHPRAINLPASHIEIMNILDTFKDKKIILYQGVFGFERSLDCYIEAVLSMGSSYQIILMGRRNNALENLLNKYPEVIYIPFIKPPQHLEVTSHAHIGIITYDASIQVYHYSKLNALYCAPNKMYEYAGFGIPMVGNSIPGLRYPFEKYRIGVCAEKLTVHDICLAIKKIELNYEKMKENCLNFFDNTDLDKIVDDILQGKS